MPWDYILGGAGGGAIVLIVLIVVAPKVIERLVQNQLDVKLQHLRGVQIRNLEFDKSELEVWAEIRKDILMQIWVAHREIVGAMTTLILRTQELGQANETHKLQPDIDQYRRTIHKSVDLISPDAVLICQDFLETAYAISGGRAEHDDANPLKEIRRKFYEYMANLYGLEKMMPWMTRNAPDA
jgi:hypothetical protein